MKSIIAIIVFFVSSLAMGASDGEMERCMAPYLYAASQQDRSSYMMDIQKQGFEECHQKILMPVIAEKRSAKGPWFIGALLLLVGIVIGWMTGSSKKSEPAAAMKTYDEEFVKANLIPGKNISVPKYRGCRH